MKITIENICAVCGKKGCKQHCKKWYVCFEEKPVDFGFVDGDKEVENEKFKG